ncbi:MAG TPA: formate dehydrogenase accessory sulfurtransferase FdhD [Terrimicrobiaceae bacterium]
MSTDLCSSLVEVRRLRGDLAIRTEDSVAIEEPLEIQIGQDRKGVRTIRSVSVTMRTPGHDDELAVGFLFGEGILNQRSDVVDIVFPAVERETAANCVRVQLRVGVTVDFKQLERNFYATSSCGVCGKASLEAVRKIARGPRPSAAEGFRVSAATIHQMAGRLRESQEIFEQTGGLHAAALFDASGGPCLVREDVGRHNAVDKVVGAKWLASSLPVNDRILFVSGRASFELVQKAARAGIPILAAVGAPSSLAIELAQASGMTLLGFVRDGGFNIYSADFRILRPERIRRTSPEVIS